MSKRPHCPICQYPIKVCICHALIEHSPPCNLIILQHPSESKHAKNSARLVKLGLPDTEIIVGESTTDFIHLKQQVLASPQDFHVFYPGDQSLPVEKHANTLRLTPPKTMLFIDATWRKALKMWHLNPWLDLCQQWHFSAPPGGQYQIRKTTVEHGLSTLEAVTYSLELCYDFDGSNLFSLFSAMQAHHLAYRD